MSIQKKNLSNKTVKFQESEEYPETHLYVSFLLWYFALTST